MRTGNADSLAKKLYSFIGDSISHRWIVPFCARLIDLRTMVKKFFERDDWKNYGEARLGCSYSCDQSSIRSSTSPDLRVFERLIGDDDLLELC
jgi:hypothetical protein